MKAGTIAVIERAGSACFSLSQRCDWKGELGSAQQMCFGEEVSRALVQLRQVLGERSTECYLTGGFVRDALLRRATDDIDLVVSGNALELARCVADGLNARCIPLNEPNQIARVIVPPQGHLHLDFATMRGAIDEDLRLRDYTINAMAIGLDEALAGSPAFIDPLDGRRDLESRRVRAVSESVLQEDPARLIRGPRFAAELGFSIDEETRTFIRRNSSLIGHVARERVRDELCRILAMPKAAQWVRLLDDLGLLLTVIPELAAAKGVEQPREHFWDVFDHLVETVSAVEFLLRLGGADHWGEPVRSVAPWSQELEEHFREEVSGGRARATLLKVAALLHDIAKPQTKSVEDNGRTRFFGHAQEGAAIAEGILRRLRFSTREAEMVKTMVEHHMRPGQMGDDMPTRRAIYRYFRDTGDVGLDTIFLNLADHLAARGPLLDSEQWRAHASSMAYVIAESTSEQSVVTPPKLIDGHDLIDSYGMRPGREIGELLDAVREAQAAGEVSSREEALALVERLLYDRQRN